MTLHAVTEYRHFKAPQSPNTSFVDPCLSELDSWASRVWEADKAADIEFCGQSWTKVRQLAREEAVGLAAEYTSRYADVSLARLSDASSSAVVLSGHQPELFHAGVWFKNVLLSRFAEQQGAVALNFLVDNDLCRDPSIRVPSCESSGKLVAANVAFDSYRTPVPWELRSLESWDVWHDFPKQVERHLGPLIDYQPLLQQLWPLATEALSQGKKVGASLAQARHRLEMAAGLRTLEIPLSMLVSTAAFARFSIQLLSELPRFQEVYNSQREAYRSAHRIRNAAHPVPQLEQSDGWIEGPWWVYRNESPIRHRLWIRLLNDQLILSDRAGWQEVIEGRLDCDSAAEQWLELQTEGICLRPRALLTTMYLRLIVGDLFLHGIGGGKYDQLTDGIIHEFFGIQPPLMGVASATLRLPLQHPKLPDSQTLKERIQLLRQDSWQGKHHAENWLKQPNSEAQQLAADKAALLAEIPPKGQKWEWHRAMRRINDRLQELTASQVQQGQKELADLQTLLRQASLLESREFSFCLFPFEETLGKLKELANSP